MIYFTDAGNEDEKTIHWSHVQLCHRQPIWFLIHHDTKKSNRPSRMPHPHLSGRCLPEDVPHS